MTTTVNHRIGFHEAPRTRAAMLATRALSALMLLVLAAAPARIGHAQISGLFNTGVDPSAFPLPALSQDRTIF